MTERKRGAGPRHGSSSLFWPIILIGAGVFLLIDQTNPDLFAVSPWTVALRLWPLLLILAGVDLLFGRGGAFNALIGIVLGLLLIGVVVLVAINPETLPGVQFAAQFNQTEPGEIVVPGEGVEQATATLVTDDGFLEITALEDSTAVFAGDLSYYGALDFEHSLDDGEARIRLGTSGGGGSGVWYDPTTWFNPGEARETWAIRLAPVTPYTLRITGDDGEMDLDLADLSVRDLAVEFDDGTATVTLPRQLREGAFTLDDGTLSIALPAIERSLGVQVRLSIDDGSFDPGPLERVSGDDQDGVWESDGYDPAEVKVRLSITVDDGTVTLR